MVIMFGMGSSMSLKDFADVIRMPKGVIMGVLCQFLLMPMISMVGIALVIGIITAAGRDSLLSIGVILVVAIIAHNVLGYLSGLAQPMGGPRRD